MAYGRLRWPKEQYYKSSPQEFYYACLGYFDEREDDIMLMRNVALFASQLGGKDFSKFWPGKKKEAVRIVMDEEMKKQILAAHNIKL